MLVVVLKDWVIETNETECWSKNSTSLAKSASERGQPVDLVDDNDVDLAGLPWAAESINQKIFLPRQSGELRFSPQQYYYGASKSGVMPSWAISAGAHPA